MEPPPAAPRRALALRRAAAAHRERGRPLQIDRPGAAEISVSAFFGATECAHAGSGTSVGSPHGGINAARDTSPEEE